MIRGLRGLDLVGGDTLADAPKQVRDRARIASVIDPVVNEQLIVELYSR